MNEMKQYTKELHKKVIKNYERRKVSTFGNDDIWAIDLADVSNKSSKNKGINFLLTIIDIYSRYAWAIPLKNKMAGTILKAFETFKRLPDNIWCDEGNEFYNKDFKAFCIDKGINLYHTHSGLKSVFVERFNRTLKEKIELYLTEHKTKTYINQLNNIMKEYNNTIHSKTKQTPYDVYFENAIPYNNVETTPSSKQTYKVGDFVRITKYKGIFDKGYERGWRHEVFKVRAVDNTQLPVMYELEDLLGEELTGKFYDQELQISKLKNFFIFEKMIKQKTENKKKYYLIKFEGYPDKFNKWVTEEEYKKLK